MDFTNHKINQLRLQNFTCFEDITMDFCPGINVLIGENGTGKTHVLKVLYGFLLGKQKSSNSTWINNPSSTDQHYLSTTYLASIFKTEWAALSRHDKHNSTQKYLQTSIFIEYLFNQQNAYHTYPATNELQDFLAEKPIPSIVYLPPTGMLSFYNGFRASYENRELDFDYTYYELSKLLSLNKLKGAKKQEADILKQTLLQLVEGNISSQKDGFYYEYANNLSISAKMAADGENKIAQIIYLIENGSINKNTTLIWDEPEVSLNPKWINIVAQFIVALANMGIQVIVATHDYLLSNKLSLYSEHRQQYEAKNIKLPEFKFFCFNKNERDTTEIISGENLLSIDSNPILDEFLAYYNEAERLENLLHHH